MATIPNRKPTSRKVQVRNLVYALDGAEKPYPVYQFSHGKIRYERPRHNPFAGLVPS